MPESRTVDAGPLVWNDDWSSWAGNPGAVAWLGAGIACAAYAGARRALSRPERREGMKMRYEIAVLFLWVIAIGATVLLVREPGTFGHLSPVYAICMIGSVVSVRRARRIGRAWPDA